MSANRDEPEYFSYGIQRFFQSFRDAPACLRPPDVGNPFIPNPWAILPLHHSQVCGENRGFVWRSPTQCSPFRMKLLSALAQRRSGNFHKRRRVLGPLQSSGPSVILL